MKALAQMHACETSLLHTDFKRHPELLELMLAPDFHEISAAGRSDRNTVKQWLLQKDPYSRWELSQFEVVEMTNEIRLVSYHALQREPTLSPSKGSMHTSVWSYSANVQCWQLRFHQASKIV